MENTFIDTDEELVNTLGLELPEITDASDPIQYYLVGEIAEAKTFEVQLDNQGYAEKPKSCEVGQIRWRVSKGKTSLTLGELAEQVLKGRSFTPAIYKNGRQIGDEWESQQLFGLDFDHGITVQDFMERARALGVFPNIVYSTFSDSPEEPRFRALFLLPEPITNRKTRDAIQAGLHSVFSEVDAQCMDAARLFFGGKALLHFDERITLTADDLVALGPPVGGDEPPARPYTSMEDETEIHSPKVSECASEYAAKSIWGPFKDAVYERLQFEHLSQIYDLAGAQSGGYYVARDPSSKSGDRNPSAGVTDGVNTELPCGYFKSFRDPLNRTINPFDYLMEYRSESFPTFQDAAKFLAELTGVSMPAVEITSLPIATAGPVFKVLKPMPISEWLYSVPPLPDWVIENLLERQTVGALVGDGGIGKGWFLLEYGVCAAVGKAAFPSLPVRQPQRIAFLTSEDTRNQLHRRVLSIVEHFAFDDTEKGLLQANLFLFAECDGPLLSSKDLATDTPRYSELLQFAITWKPDLIMIDPKSRWTALNEDSNSEQCAFVAKLEAVARAANGALLISHHTGKSGKESESGMAARGASAFTHSARMQTNMLHADSKDFIQFPSLEDAGARGEIVKLVVAKANGKKLEAPLFFSRCRETGVLSEIVIQDSGADRRDETILSRCLEVIGADETFAFNMSDVKARSAEVRRFKDALSLNETYEAIGAALSLGMDRKLLALKRKSNGKKEILVLAAPVQEETSHFSEGIVPADVMGSDPR